MLQFEVVRRRGSHIVLRGRAATCVVPDHRELATGTLSGILTQAGVTREQFISRLTQS